ncbi:MAG: hypothetical protein ACI4PF_00115 [Christensenellales bacterium]
MPKKIIIDDDQIVNSTDWEGKANKIIAKLGETLFNKLDEQQTIIDEETGETKPIKKANKFAKNMIKADLQPVQVTSKLNRLLRIYKPLSIIEARTIQDIEYLKAFGYYCDIISYINEYLVYMPDKQTFCAFINITTDIYNEFLGDPNYMQVFMSFEDSFNSTNFLAAQAGVVDGKVTITKLQTKDAGHNLVRNPEALTINNYNAIDKQQVNLKLEQWESMVSKIPYGSKK